LIDEEGVGETSGQRPDRTLEERLRVSKAGPAEETVFLRTVRIALYPQFHGRPPADVRSGPDVFADALVPAAERAASGPHLPKTSQNLSGAASRWGPAHCAHGYRFAKPARSTLSVAASKSPAPQALSNPAGAAAGCGRLHPVHREP